MILLSTTTMINEGAKHMNNKNEAAKDKNNGKEAAKQENDGKCGC